MDDKRITVTYDGVTYKNVHPFTEGQIAAIGMMRGNQPAFVLRLLRTLGTASLGEATWQEITLALASGEKDVAWVTSLLLAVASANQDTEDNSLPAADGD